MADREWRRDADEYRERSEFLDDRDYGRSPYQDRYDTRYNSRSFDTRDYEDRESDRYGDRPGVTDRIRNWWHRNVTDAGEERPYDRDYSHAAGSGWDRDRDWKNRRITGDTPYTDRDWRTDSYTRAAGASTYGIAGSYTGGLYSSSGTERGRYTGRGPKSWRRSDERIREDVNEELTRHPDVDASDIEVAVINSEVTLTGTVDGRHDKREAEECAWRVSGVKDVHNQLRIKQGVGSVIASVFDNDRR